jgi:hypothetical protein
MPRPCESCRHPKADIINRKLKQGVTLGDISRWLESEGHEFYLSTAALGRHRAHVMPDEPAKRGAKPYAGDFLELVRNRAAEAVASGEARVSVQHGLQAQAQLDARVSRNADRDLMAQIAAALTGQLPPIASADEIEGEYREADSEFARAQAEFTALLTAGE